jgi:hypothetical protein
VQAAPRPGGAPVERHHGILRRQNAPQAGIRSRKSLAQRQTNQSAFRLTKFNSVLTRATHIREGAANLDMVASDSRISKATRVIMLASFSLMTMIFKLLPPLIDMPNDDVSPVDIGTDAAPQLHIIEMDNGHSTLAFKRRKAFRGPVYDHLGRDGRYVQKSTGCLSSFGVIAIIPSERQR